MSAPTSLAEPASARLTRYRGLLVVTALVLVTAVLLGWWRSQQARGFLDPAGVDPGGSRALVRLLEAQGVDVIPARTVGQVQAGVRAAADPAAASVLVTLPAGVRHDLVATVVDTGADLVLVTPGVAVEEWPGGIANTGGSASGVLAPDCPLPVAVRAGDARVGGQSFAGAGVGCYPTEAGPSLFVGTEADGRRVVALGSPSVLTNERLGEDGNAALALGLLGSDPVLVWYRPVPEAGGSASVGDLVPGWVQPAIAMISVAALLAALWRARRLGPLVHEPLPVTVRAVETVEGRGHLYRRAGDRQHTAAALREASLRRLSARLGLPPGAAPEHVVAAIAARSGRDPVVVHALLDTGMAPPDDAALVRLAQDLDRLEQEVFSP